ncbi:hypothetical protein TIFTF001_039106 [Ficus carica]|uniref:Uncharacterized protein n=1 Tax=Ficus carica TaxID=3494 RepID=A0AA88E8W9_FICCA|nr:hypothetical protein TIFTF001_039106 [Ficus carica]
MAVGLAGYPLTSFALLVSGHAAAPYVLGDGVDDPAKEGGFDDPKDTAATSSSSPPSPPPSGPAPWIEHHKEQGGFTAPLSVSTSHPDQQARLRRKKSSLTSATYDGDPPQLATSPFPTPCILTLQR